VFQSHIWQGFSSHSLQVTVAINLSEHISSQDSRANQTNTFHFI